LKKLLFFFLVFLLSNAAISQNTKSTISINIGPSVPVGNYSKTDQANSLSGYAKMGSAVSLSYAYSLSDDVSIIAMFALQKNAINTTAFESQLSQSAFGFAGGAARYYGNWDVQEKSWFNKYGLLGLSKNMLKGKKSNKVSLHVKLLAGLVNSKSPEFNASSKSDTSYVLMTQGSQSATGFCYVVGADAGYKISRLFSIVLSLDYTGSSQLSFKNVQQRITATNGGLVVPGLHWFSNSVWPPIITQAVYEAKQPISTINVRAGVSISF